MSDVFLYSYVEDTPSAEVAKRIVAEANLGRLNRLAFHPGFPTAMRGYGTIQKKSPDFLNMAKNGLHVLVLTDLDKAECVPAFIRVWFRLRPKSPIVLPDPLIFRVAVREVESWVLADRDEWAKYIGISKDNFSANPETLPDPKLHLLNIIRRKGKRKLHQEMLPTGTASIGPRYNEIICDFVEKHWSPRRACARSDSLARALTALAKV